MKAARSTILLGAVALSLSGCASLLVSKPAPLDTYELSAPSVTGQAVRTQRQILVVEPSTLKQLDGQNIVIKPSAGSVEFLKGAQWSDRLPRIVQARLIETFQRTGYVGVGKPGDGLAIDYQVIMEMRSFGINVGGSQRAEVELFVRLLNDRTGQIHASRDFMASVPVSGTSNDAYVAALNKAFGQVAGEIVSWTKSKI